LAAIRSRIGYPERWRDYSGLRVDRNDLLGNLHRSTVFERNYVLSKAGKSVDADEWELNPTTTEVRYALDRNSLLLPAGVLQPPLFDPTADPALNFGSLGVLAAHELTHGFDTLGSKFDENGSMREWQAPQDRQRFAETASCYVAEYSQFRAMPGPDELPRLKVNGNLTLTENTADNGGLQIAFRALMDALAAEKRTVGEKIDGYTETQRFFLAFAQLSCQNQTLYSARRSLSTDAQSQGRARVNGAVQNLDEFGKAFQCVKGQPMYSSKPCRVW
jgi:putative endopeptidase